MTGLWVPPSASAVRTRPRGQVNMHRLEGHPFEERLRHGDEHIGWRGDPDAELWRRPSDDTLFVMLRDAENVPYVACAIDPGEEMERLLFKLRDGDWQRGGPSEMFARQRRAQIQMDEARRAAHREHVSEKVAPRLYDVVKQGHRPAATKGR